MGFSFRIEEQWINVLREEAERQERSINSLMNLILQNYSQHWRWSERLNAMFVTPRTFSRIISCCPENKLEEIAKESGSIGAKDALRTMGITPTYLHLTEFIKNNMGKSGNWFDYSQHTRGRTEIIHLRHTLDKNWSIFIALEIKTMFQSILDLPTKTEIRDNYVTLEVTL
jgi:hypothetical protein